MPRVKQIICPECGTPAEDPYKTWELVSPIPDKEMRITLTVFGMYKCSKCGKKYKGVVSKARLSPEGVQL